MHFPKSFSGTTFLLPAVLPIVFASHAFAVEPVRSTSQENSSVSAEATVPSELSLIVDFASILQIDGEMSAVAVGNPEIADASMADQRTVILTGRVAGVTNLIALNNAGQVLADVTVRVTSQKPGVVTVRRGTQVQTYSCTSAYCEGPAEGSAAQINDAAEPEVIG